MCACRVHGGGVPSRGLTWRTCSEASNNSITKFRPFTYDYVFGPNLMTDGLRVLCAPHPRAAAAATVASGSGSLHSDLRDNALEEFAVEDFLAQALQLKTLYAAANACRAHRMIALWRAGSPAATHCTAARAQTIAGQTKRPGWVMRRSQSNRGRQRCTLRSPIAQPPDIDRYR